MTATAIMRPHSDPPNGRPTRDHAVRRHAELLDRALDLFLRHGYELTTVEAIADSLRMTKRTVYRRYADKRGLFSAAVQRAIDQLIAPVEAYRALATDDLETTLRAIATLRMANTLSPEGLRLQRIINAESLRFPDIVLAYEEAAMPARRFIAGLLRDHAGRDLPGGIDADFAAIAFLGIIAAPGRLAVLGKPIDPAEIERSVGKCVTLFLDGLRHA